MLSAVIARRCKSRSFVEQGRTSVQFPWWCQATLGKTRLTIRNNNQNYLLDTSDP